MNPGPDSNAIGAVLEAFPLTSCFCLRVPPFCSIQPRYQLSVPLLSVIYLLFAFLYEEPNNAPSAARLQATFSRLSVNMSTPQADPNAPLFGAARNVNRNGLLVIVWVCFTIATVFVSLRLWVRWQQNRRFLADDCWIFWAWLCTLTMAILQTEQMDALWYMTHLQAGRIPFDPEEMVQQRYELTKWQFPIIKMFWIILWSIKASFLAIFFRLVQPFNIIRRLWYCVAVFTAAALVVCVICSALTCDPPSDYFHGKYKSST